MPDPIWFWQRIVSPHMVGLVSALAEQGREVTYVAEQPMSQERAILGWQIPDLGAARLRLAPDADAVAALVKEAPRGSIHVCQGFRGNGLVGVAQEALAQRHLSQWVVVETIEEKGRLSSWAKRLEYRRQIMKWRKRIDGVLATGHATPDWLAARGMPRERIFPFAYFLPERMEMYPPAGGPSTHYRVLFVGQFIERKRLNLLINALANVANDCAFELAVIGAGPLENELLTLARSRLAGRFEWVGQLSQDKVLAYMDTADCLVLPSRHDGWGAVISEALMAGTPVICSDRCGAAGVVEASGQGGVFRSGNVHDLTRLLRREISSGPQTFQQRSALARWAQCLGAMAGAEYLIRILERPVGADHPLPPWQKME